MKYLGATFVAVCSALALHSVAAAQPQSNREPVELRVSTRYVDFNNPQSVADFDQRLSRAAQTACDSGASFDLRIRIEDAQCAHKAWERAAKSLDQPLLSALHHQTTSLAQAAIIDQK